MARTRSRQTPDPSGFVWNEHLRRYQRPDGRMVARAEVRAALDRVAEAAQARIEQLSGQLRAGTITLADWQRQVAEAIRTAHTAAAASAAGGWAQATAADWGTAGARVRQQYEHLARFASDIATGQQPLDGRMTARSAMYGRSARVTFEAVNRRRDAEAGYDEERRYLGSHRPCDDCVAYASLGWQPAGTLPLPTEACACRSNCHCRVARRRRGAAPPPTPNRPPSFGPTRAEVQVEDLSGAADGPTVTALEHARQILGRPVSLLDLASLAGAPDDARVTVQAESPFRLTLRVDGPGYEAERKLINLGRGPYLWNEWFAVTDPARRGKGLGRAVFGRQVETATRLGVQEIRTVAGGGPGQDQNGYYTWPRFGYDAPLPERIAARLPESLRPAARLSDLMRTPEGRQWWKDHGEAMEVRFDLGTGSLSRRVWDQYLATKTAE